MAKIQNSLATILANARDQLGIKPTGGTVAQVGRRMSHVEPAQTKKKSSGAVSGEDNIATSAAISNVAKNESEPEDENIPTPVSRRVEDSDLYEDFQKYSDDNLGGQSAYDFMTIDPETESVEDEMGKWRAMLSDPVMSGYFANAVEEAGGIDQFLAPSYDTSWEDLMNADIGTQNDFIGTNDGIIQDAFGGLATAGYIPAVSGTGQDSDDMIAMLASDPELAANTMIYNYTGDTIRANPSAALSNLTDEEAANLFGLIDSSEYGYGDDYSIDGNDVDIDGMTFELDPNAFMDTYGQSDIQSGMGLPWYGAPELLYQTYGMGRKAPEGTEEDDGE